MDPQQRIHAIPTLPHPSVCSGSNILGPARSIDCAPMVSIGLLKKTAKFVKFEKI